MMKAFSQRYPNREYRNTYLVSSLHVTVVSTPFGLIVPIETICAAKYTHTSSHAKMITQAIGGTKNT